MARTAIVLLEPGGESACERALDALADRFERSAVLEAHDRAGLAAGLELVARTSDATLVVPALASVAASLEELLELLDWLAAAGAHLYAIDVELDSATPAGRRAVAVLRALARTERQPARGHSPRGRPGLASSAPELASRIAALRERGVSLQAIADELNRDGVPTPRGGALWRPSSVQAALGYRRPRPPGPLPPRPAAGPHAGAPPRPGRPAPDPGGPGHARAGAARQGPPRPDPRAGAQRRAGARAPRGPGRPGRSEP